MTREIHPPQTWLLSIHFANERTRMHKVIRARFGLGLSWGRFRQFLRSVLAGLLSGRNLVTEWQWPIKRSHSPLDIAIAFSIPPSASVHSSEDPNAPHTLLFILRLIFGFPELNNNYQRRAGNQPRDMFSQHMSIERIGILGFAHFPPSGNFSIYILSLLRALAGASMAPVPDLA